MTASILDRPKIASRAEWLLARKALLAKEKELTRARDEVSRQLRELPWVPVEKNYVFDGTGGKPTLSDLFAGRSQLIIYHFMFGPGWKEGCVGCSFLADHLAGVLTHLEHHDVSLVVVSRAPLAEIAPFKQRMGWTFPWVSSFGSDFNYDYHVSYTKEELARGKVYHNFEMNESPSEELSGISVFYKDAQERIFHTYSSYARGGDILLGTYNYLDLTPKGRNENGPRHNLTDWVRHHDRYQAGGYVDHSGRYQEEEKSGPCCHGESSVRLK
ncbi:MAG: DUF899 domain-containing protein [Acidobacteria bacterium]|jgi:predicted dithiol-disulfide oxidoreductase (DUF899 family)|nr:DUF899 domain-containing protein [Acidobacteriota bacterium]